MANRALSADHSDRLFVLWDDSHLWGLLLWRALAHFGCDHRLVTAAEVAAGVLAERPTALLVPGGAARRKAEALGAAGVAAVREYVSAGGNYFGFCGGAGLGLEGGGLGLCPWTRRGFTERFQHFVSGHMRVAAGDSPLTPPGLGARPLVPVWWPGRFEVCAGNGVEVLAAYEGPGPDVMVADILLSGLPRETLGDWEALYGVRLSTEFMRGQPCMVRGRLGAGQYVLSYAHLETPDSPEANAWLAHLLGRMGARVARADTVPAWELAALPARFPDPLLAEAAEAFEEVIRLGQEHFLLFRRSPWLLGWRRGIPGAAVSSLYALAREVLAAEPDGAALRWWRTRREEFAQDLELFRKGVTGYLLAERLAMTLASAPGACCITGLKEQRLALFGPPPSMGGLYGRLAHVLEELVRRSISGGA